MDQRTEKRNREVDTQINLLKKAAKDMRILASDVRMLEVTKADATTMERC